MNNNNTNQQPVDVDCVSCRLNQEHTHSHGDPRNGLDLTPVKDDTGATTTTTTNRGNHGDANEEIDERANLIEYNYEGSLHIDSIHLPSISATPQVTLAPSGNIQDNGPNNKLGIDQVDSSGVSNRRNRQQRGSGRYIRPDDVFLTPIPMPPAKHVSSTGRYTLGANSANYNSDTDSSLMQGPCCQMPPFKTKRCVFIFKNDYLF